MKWTLAILCVALIGTVYGQVPANPCLGNTLVWVDDPIACPNYFWCAPAPDRTPFPGRCGAGLNFDQTRQACAANAPCEVCPATGIAQVPDPDNCQNFFFCVDGEETLQSCGAGALFDPTDNECNLADKVKCLPGSEVEAECDPAVLETVFMPDPVSCNFFAVCHAGLFVERRQCRAGLSFDPATLACADSETVVCVVSDFLANDLNIPRPPQIGKSVNKMRHPLQMPLFKKRFGLF